MDNTPVLYSFMAFLAAFLCIGLLSIRRRRKSSEDYLLASREVSPILVGLSAAASTASGFGFTGMIGFGYSMGLAAGWFVVGIMLGAFVTFRLTSRSFRTYSQRYGIASYSEYLSMKLDTHQRLVQLVIGLITLAAVILYATGQLAAGSKALHVLFGWHYNVGAIMGAIIVVLYCFAGGIRASIWTDAAQIIVMIAAMALLLAVALSEIGGPVALINKLATIQPSLAYIWPRQAMFGPVLFIAGWFFGGVAVAGFPHAMIRFMTLKNPRDTDQAIFWYFLCYAGFYVLAFLVAVCTRVLLPPDTVFDAELALPMLAMNSLPAIFVGLILSGIFASTISTADSLVLSATATMSRDIFPRWKDSYMFLKLCTLGITGLALVLALFGPKSVFDIILIAVAVMGACFAPLLIIRSLRWPLGGKTALAMMATALTVIVVWRALGWEKGVFDAMPGILSAFTVYVIGTGLARITDKKKAA
ncbi:MAG: sodium/proline symporter [Rhodospirillales bacterium]|nr:sodium/proline symporter [Rhodospirillales bacterium]